MIKEVSGDLLLSKAQVIAHGVAPNDPFHTGLALQLREQWPAMYKDFRHYCQSKHPKPGTLWAWMGADGKRLVSLFTQDAIEGHHGGTPGPARRRGVVPVGDPPSDGSDTFSQRQRFGQLPFREPPYRAGCRCDMQAPPANV